jgi:hypothetical protein
VPLLLYGAAATVGAYLWNKAENVFSPPSLSSGSSLVSPLVAAALGAALALYAKKRGLI